MFNNNSKIVKRVMHIKGRRSCNQPCKFQDCNKLELHEVGDKALGCEYIIRPTEHSNIQCCPVLALSTCNTENFISSSKGITNVEGGWPRDVSSLDGEQVARYRKKIERDDTYSKQVLELCKMLERVILQNNAVNIYQVYFKDQDSLLPVAEKCYAKTTNIYKDYTGERVNRCARQLNSTLPHITNLL